MAHQAGAYPGFCSMKRLGVFLLPPGGMLVHRRVIPSSKFAGTHLYTWVERGTMGVKCLAQEHNTVPRPGLEPRPLDTESSALTIRPPRLPLICQSPRFYCYQLLYSNLFLFYQVFQKARAAAPSIVFFDEIDALAARRGSGGDDGASNVSDRVLTQLLTELDGVETLKDVVMVAATNRPDMIDKALLRPGRIDRIIYVPLPDRDAREEIFKIHVSQTPLGADVAIAALVEKTEMFSGAEIAALCREAALMALQENIESKEVLRRHFDKAFMAVKPRTSRELIELYRKYQNESGVHSI